MKIKRSVLGWIAFLLEKLLYFFVYFLFIDGALFLFWALHFKLLVWSQRQHPAFYISIVVLSFVYFILAAFFAGGKRFYDGFDKTHLLGVLFPLALIVAIAGVATNCFGALSSLLHDYGYIRFEPTLPKHQFSALFDFYLWHFFDLIPQIKFNESVKWQLPFKPISNLQNWFLLLFKIIMIWIIIDFFYKWNKWRKEAAKKEENAVY